MVWGYYQQTHVRNFNVPGLLLLFIFRCVALLYVLIAIQHVKAQNKKVNAIHWKLKVPLRGI
jgi:hypothetical protein